MTTLLCPQCHSANTKKNGHISLLEAEADELWSSVRSKENKQWVWIAMDAHTKQVLAFYVGDRSRQSAQKLWERIPEDL